MSTISSSLLRRLRKSIVVASEQSRLIRFLGIRSGIELLTVKHDSHIHSFSRLDDDVDSFWSIGGKPYDSILEWDLPSLSPIGCYRGHTSTVRSLCAPSSNILVSASSDKTLRVWPRIDSDELNHVREVARDRIRLLSPQRGSTLSSSVRSSAFGTSISTLRGHSQWVNSVVAFPQVPSLSTCVFSGSSDRSVRQWDLPTETCLSIGYASGRLRSPLSSFPHLHLLVAASMRSVRSQRNGIYGWDPRSSTISDPDWQCPIDGPSNISSLCVMHSSSKLQSSYSLALGDTDGRIATLDIRKYSTVDSTVTLGPRVHWSGITGLSPIRQLTRRHRVGVSTKNGTVSLSRVALGTWPPVRVVWERNFSNEGSASGNCYLGEGRREREREFEYSNVSLASVEERNEEKRWRERSKNVDLNERLQIASSVVREQDLLERIEFLVRAGRRVEEWGVGGDVGFGFGRFGELSELRVKGGGDVVSSSSSVVIGRWCLIDIVS